MKRALVVVDYQNDFVDGALGFEKAKALESGIAAKVEDVLLEGGRVFFTLDTHDDDTYLNTREGKYLPVKHCIKNSDGHKLYGSLSSFTKQDGVILVEKGGFGSAVLPDQIREIMGVPDVIQLCGIVTNMCVISNAVLLQTAFENTEIQIIEPLCASFDEPLHRAAIDVMRGLQMQIVE